MLFLLPIFRDFSSTEQRKNEEFIFFSIVILISFVSFHRKSQRTLGGDGSKKISSLQLYQFQFSIENSFVK